MLIKNLLDGSKMALFIQSKQNNVIISASSCMCFFLAAIQATVPLLESKYESGYPCMLLYFQHVQQLGVSKHTRATWLDNQLIMLVFIATAFGFLICKFLGLSIRQLQITDSTVPTCLKLASE